MLPTTRSAADCRGICEPTTEVSACLAHASPRSDGDALNCESPTGVSGLPPHTSPARPTGCGAAERTRGGLGRAGDDLARNCTEGAM